jgi:hypothetical protein
MLPQSWAILWRSDLGWLAHLVGIVGFALMLASMVYSFRKRKILVRRGRMGRWLWFHHWAGFIGGVMALVHTLGNFRGIGLPLTLVLVLVLTSSGIYLIECRLRRPLTEAISTMNARKRERARLDAEYRQLYSDGHAGTLRGQELYNLLLAEHEGVNAATARVSELQASTPSLGWWRHVHNYGTLLLAGLLLVHIWSKLYFASGGP